MQFFHGTNIDFVGKRKFFVILSTLINITSIFVIIFVGIEFGIDFEGGTEIAYQFSKPVHADVIRNAVEKTGIKGGEIKSFGKENQFLVRTKETEKADTIILKAFNKYLPDIKTEVIKSDKIGPKIGKELRGQAFLAVLISIIAIMLYIAFRFEFTYGFGAVIALIHDVILTFLVVIVVNKLGWIDLEFNQSILAAMLTVVGFSVNDTVIIFDRIRENKDKMKGTPFLKLVNVSVNETLSRTINTVVTVFIVLLTIVLLGGPVLQGFAFTMLIGIITGTYSSIYIASTFVLWYTHTVKKIPIDYEPDKKTELKTAKV
ncbi:MAG: protein-export membrane protein SecF [Ignavibacteria bacterium GWB2_35_12]|nr:MAG: protein-export membrane protein SecF [Ignavibacteria bacterium GWA2_35_8]OGU42147.1 MAG: protein-export membrane protein SecF [Ignavibacteria bacterium GWB2_35_12]OGV19864.1 MAG: protein-export membrane protein SecF [Ignavibacteria bacterium RIFOXYC2_FULL_35_21]